MKKDNNKFDFLMFVVLPLIGFCSLGYLIYLIVDVCNW